MRAKIQYDVETKKMMPDAVAAYPFIPGGVTHFTFQLVEEGLPRFSLKSRQK